MPYLKLVGGLLLLWIGVKLVRARRRASDGVKAARPMWAAIRTIIIADAVMSLDNAIAIAAAAKGDFTLIVLGLVISDPAHHLRRHPDHPMLLDRFPIIVIAGGGADRLDRGRGDRGRRPARRGRRRRQAGRGGASRAPIAAWLDGTIPHAEMVCAALGAGLVLVVGLYLARRNARHAEKS